MVDSHAYYAAPANVQLRDLNEIPEYRDDKLFQNPEPKTIWARVDYARLLAVKHCFDNTDTDYVFYCDFDVEDASLNDDRVTRPLRRYGTFFGKADNRDILENGYMAFGRGKSEEFLKEYLLPSTREAAAQGDNGWKALRDSLILWTYINKIRETDISATVLHRRGYQIPSARNYASLGIN
jgi:hypothetical protein